jgi:hypothetical protein
MSKQYVVNDNKVYQVNDSDLFTTFNAVDVPEHSVDPIWKGAKIPLTMWQDIVGFCKHSYDALKSETLIYLFYDETSKTPWSWWVPPQITAGMTVKSNPDDPEYAIQRAQYPDTMFGTVHHHCSTSAFQSGTDEADETQREGLHFTVGNLNQDCDFDVHFRMTIGDMHSELDADMYIERGPDPFKRNAAISEEVKEEILQDLHEKAIQQPAPPLLNKYNVEMQNVSKASYAKKQPVLGSWYDEPYYYTSKKNEDTQNIDGKDIADDFVNAVFLDPDYEKILTDYYTARTDKNKLSLLTAGAIFDADIAEDLSEMFGSYEYQRLHPNLYQYAEDQVSKFLAEQKSNGLDFTQNDLIYELNNYENGKGLQPMDKETTI